MQYNKAILFPYENTFQELCVDKVTKRERKQITCQMKRVIYLTDKCAQTDGRRNKITQYIFNTIPI